MRNTINNSGESTPNPPSKYLYMKISLSLKEGEIIHAKHSIVLSFRYFVFSCGV